MKRNEINRNLHSCQRLQMTNTIHVNHVDFVRFQIQFRGLSGYAAWYFFQFVARASHNGAGADARWWAVAIAQAATIIVAHALELMVWQILDKDLLGLSGDGAGGLRSGQTTFTQPIREPC